MIGPELFDSMIVFHLSCCYWRLMIIFATVQPISSLVTHYCTLMMSSECNNGHYCTLMISSECNSGLNFYANSFIQQVIILYMEWLLILGCYYCTQSTASCNEYHPWVSNNPMSIFWCGRCFWHGRCFGVVNILALLMFWRCRCFGTVNVLWRSMFEALHWMSLTNLWKTAMSNLA